MRARPSGLTALILVFCLGGLPAAEAQDTADAAIAAIAHKWVVGSYNTPEGQKEAYFKSLTDETVQLAQKYPDNATMLGWEGIVISAYAAAKGGLGALDLAQQARDALEAAAKIDEKALDGGIDTTLGALYHKVPGWPIGFGDDDKARAYLLKGLALNPNGIDENFFYGDFLLDKGHKKEAQKYLENALRAPPRPGREDADAGRRQEIQADLAKLES